MSIVKGKDVTLYVYRSGIPTLTACASTCTISLEADIIPITTIDSGREDEYEGGATNATIDFSGVITLDRPDDWQFDDFVDEVGNRHRFVIQFEDAAGNILKYDMWCIIKTVSGTGAFSDFGMFDFSVIRSGAMTKTFIEGDIEEPPDEEALIDSDLIEILDSDGNTITTG